MTTDTDRARPRGLGRIDPVLRDAAASMDIVEFRTESLPAERDRADRLAAERAAAVDTGNVEIDDRDISGPSGQQLGLRLYRGPHTSAAPLVLYAHGGGFVTGNLDTDHPHCVELAREAGCLVVSVDYRLAPEHPCPAALDDVETAFRSAVSRAWAHYLGHGAATAQHVPAQRANLEGLPPAFISCAEIDPCRDEAIDYANRLLHAYVHTELHVVAATFHGFDSVVPEWIVSRESAALHARTLRRSFAV